MTDHQLFLWAAYGLSAVALLIEVVWVRAQRKRALREARERAEEGA